MAVKRTIWFVIAVMLVSWMAAFALERHILSHKPTPNVWLNTESQAYLQATSGS